MLRCKKVNCGEETFRKLNLQQQATRALAHICSDMATVSLRPFTPSLGLTCYKARYDPQFSMSYISRGLGKILINSSNSTALWRQ